MRQEDEYGLVVPIALSVIFAIAVTCIAVWLIMGSAKGADNLPADPDCLTQSEARKKFPDQWLYYHGVRHCWDNVRKYAKPDRRAKGGKVKPTPVLDANGNDVQPAPRSSIYYPSVMSGGGTADSMLTPETMTTWPLVADFDVEPVPFLPWQRITALTNR